MISVPVRNAGTYYLVFDNRFSLLSHKQVRVELRLVYDAEDRERAAELKKQEEERVKRIGAILGKLTETLQARERALGTRQINPPIRFGIIEDKSINAFAQPDRNIVALNRGMINFAESAGTPELTDAVLAGVLGHELAHVFYRHTSGNIQAQGAQAIGVGATAGYYLPVTLLSPGEKRFQILHDNRIENCGFRTSGPICSRRVLHAPQSA